MAEEDTRIGVLFGWNILLPILTILGFYFGTIAVDEHIIDLQVHDLVRALPYAGFGALLGTIIALFLTFIYPRMVHHDLRREHAVGYEPHRAEGEIFTSDLRHPDGIGPGQH